MTEPLTIGRWKNAKARRWRVLNYCFMWCYLNKFRTFLSSRKFWSICSKHSESFENYVLVATALPLQEYACRGPGNHEYCVYRERPRNDAEKYSFTFRVVENWNKLPRKWSTPSINSFKNKLDMHKKWWSKKSTRYGITSRVDTSPGEVNPLYYQNTSDCISYLYILNFYFTLLYMKRLPKSALVESRNGNFVTRKTITPLL